jgi:pSer/pThr/pTyr-binding forkhead associated (FHA) protein
VVLQDPTKWVSRFHAEIRANGSAYTIVDLGGANGIRVNGQETSEAPLFSGTKVDLGPYQVEFVSEGGTAEPAAPTVLVAPSTAGYPVAGSPPPRTPSRPPAPQQTSPVVLPPPKPMGKLARQALTFLAIGAIVAAVAAIDARREPKRVPPPAALPRIALPTPDPNPAPSPNPTTSVEESAALTSAVRAQPTSTPDNPDIPRRANESDPKYKNRIATILKLYQSKDGPDLDRAIQNLRSIGEDRYQPGGYLSSDARLNDLLRARRLMTEAAAENDRLADAWDKLDTAKGLLGEGFDINIPQLKTDIQETLGRKADSLERIADQYLASRGDSNKQNAITLYTRIRDLLPLKSDLRQKVEAKLAQLNK